MVICVDSEFRTSGAVALMIDRLHKTGKAKHYTKGELSKVLKHLVKPFAIDFLSFIFSFLFKIP